MLTLTLRTAVIAVALATTSVLAQTPSISTQPQSQTVLIGNPVSLSASADAVLPVTPSGTLRLWLKADAGVVTNNQGYVSQWQDQSGNVNHASSVTPAGQPTLVRPATLNGRAAVRFDGVRDNVNGDYLHGSGDVGIPNAYTSFMVYNAFQTTNNDNLVTCVGTPGPVYGGCRMNGIGGHQISYSGWSDDYTTTYVVPTNTYRIWTDRANTNLSQVEIFDTTGSASTNFTFTTSGFSAPAAEYFIGGFNPSYAYVGNGYNFNGDMAEVLYYRGRLTDADRLAVESYLKQKYFQPSAVYTYQWRFNGVNVSGATNSSVVIDSVQNANAGSYDVVICNGAACATSSTATLTVNVPAAAIPVILQQPASQTALSGDDVSLSVSVLDNNGDPVLPTATSGTLRLWLKADAGVVINSQGSVSQWQDQSGNANHASAVTPAGQPALARPAGINGHATVRFDGVRDNVNGDYLHGSGDVGIPNAYTSFIVYDAFQTTNSENLISCVGTPGNVYGGCRMNGTSAQKLGYSGWTDDYITDFVMPTNTYRIWTDRANTNLSQVDVFDTTATTSTPFTFATSGFSAPAAEYFIGGFNPSYPTVVQGRNFNGDMAEVLFYRGSLTESDRLAVELYLKKKYLLPTSVGPFTYQWLSNGTPVAGATNSTLTLQHAQVPNSGTYTVVVSNAVGSVTSAGAVVDVKLTPPLEIVSQPVSQSVFVGDSPTLSVTVLDNSRQALPAVSSGAVRLWLKADSGVVTNGSGQVSQWQDQSGNNNHAAQANTNLQPRLISSSLVKGRPALHFDGIDDAAQGDFMHGSGDVSIPNAFTSFMIYSATNYRPDTTVPWLVGVSGGTYGADRVNAFVNGGQMYFSSWAYDYGTGFFPPLGTARLWEDRFDTNMTHIEQFDVTANSHTNFSTPTSGESTPAPGYYIGGLDPSIGSTGYNYRFPGDISELIIYRGSLTETDRGAVEQYLSKKYLQPLSGITYQWQLNGTNIANATNSSLTFPNVQLASAGTYDVIVSDGVNTLTSSNAVLTVNAGPTCTPPASGLIGWWPGEGDASDFFGANNGTLVNGVSFASGKVGQAFTLHGNDYVGIADSAQLRPTNITISGWFSFARSTGVQSLVTKTAGTGTYESFVLYTQNGTLSATVGSPSGIGQILNYNLNPTLGTWYHIAYTFDTTTKQQALYVNGLLRVSGTTQTSIGYDNHPTMIGAEYENEFLDYYFAGKADEVMLFNRALGSSEIAAIYNAGTAGVCKSLIITAQPADQAAAVGANATFSVKASGNLPISYQWTANGNPIANGTNSSLTLTNVQLTDAGTYSVLVTNSTESVASSNAVLTVGFAPTITTQPTGQTVVQGTNVDFAASATGSGLISYQWYFNNVAITGATTPNLSLTNVQSVNSGNYSVVASNSFGSATSSNAVLEVDAPPQITVQPQSQFAAQGSTVTLSSVVSVASSLPAISSGTLRLWLKADAGVITNGSGQVSTWLDQSGNTNDASQPNTAQQPRLVNSVGAGGRPVVRFDGIQSATTGDYMQGSADVGIPDAVTGFAVFSESSTADAGGNGKEIALVGVPSTQGSCRGIGIYNNALTFTTWGYSYDFRTTVNLTPDSYHIATFRLNTNDTVADVYDRIGTNSTPFTFAASGQSAPGAGYYVGGAGSLVRNLNGDIGEVIYYRGALTDSDRVAVEQYLQQKYNPNAVPNGFSYQWQFNGSNLPGQTNASLIITNVQFADAGTYNVVVTNLAGATTSSNAVLVVGLAPSISAQPQSTAVGVGTAATFAVSATGTDPLSYQWKFNGTAIALATNSAFSIANAQTTNNGSYSVIVSNLFGAVTSSNAVLRVDLNPQIISQPQSQTILAGNTATFSVATDAVLPTVTSGTLRLWLKADAGVVTNSNNLVSRWSDQSTNANHANQSNTAQQPVLVRPAGINGRAALRFDGFQSSSTGDYLIGTNDVGIPDAFTAFILAEPSSLSSVNVPVFVGAPGTTGAGRCYSLISGQLNFSTWASDYTTGLVPKTGVYRIWTERLSSSRTFAEMFDTTATNGTNFSWNIATPSTPAAQYYVGGLGAFTRNFAGDIAEVIYYRGSLTDSDRLAVEGYLRQKYYQVVPLSGLTYQWQYNGVNIAGATNTSLTVSNAQAAAAGTYTVSVCNGSACVTSSNATLTVNVPPFITQQPIDQNVIVGTAASFTANADGTGPLSYQWRHDGANISGATNTTLNIAAAQQSDAGLYALVVSNSFGSATSSNAVLSVTTSTLIVANVSGSGSSTIQVPMLLSALGNENALGFSLNFDPTLLLLSSIELGSNATSATIFANTNQQSSGRAGVVVSFTSGETFPAGTQEVAVITFNVGIVATNVVTPLTLGDSPTVRQISDSLANSLPGTYVSGSATLSQTVFEGDVAPRPNGDQRVTITDWVQVGRFVAGLDAVGSDGEFQRIDCAPRNTLGNAKLTVSDWVQAGRYAVGLDSLTPVGGPTTLSGHALIKPRVPTTRTVSLQTSSTNGPTNVVSVQLNSQGDESAIGFSLTFDKTLVRFAGATVGSGATGASMNVNASNATNGTIGVALELPFGKTFTAGTQEVVRLNFVPVVYSPGASNLTFTDSPIVSEVSDATANALSAGFVNSSLATTGLLPVLAITQDGAGNVTMSWTAAANGYGLESVSDLSTNWSPVSATVVTNGANVFVTQPAATNQMYFRLRHP